MAASLLTSPRKLDTVWLGVRAALAYISMLSVGAFFVLLALHSLPDAATVALQAGEEPTAAILKIPRSFYELRRVHRALELYRGQYFLQVLALFTALYLFMQSCIIPGCFFLNILVGALLPTGPAIVLVTCLTTLGCSINFFTSKYLFSGMVKQLAPTQLARFHALALQHKSHLLHYVLFLRLMPMLPSWLVNAAAPHANISFSTFALATAAGFQPQLWVMVTAGTTLRVLRSWRDLYSWRSILVIVAMACLTMVPVVLRMFVPSNWTNTSPDVPEHGSLEAGLAKKRGGRLSSQKAHADVRGSRN